MPVVLDHLSIGSWNICGAKNKLNDPDFLELLKEHDIIILGETFADGDTVHVDGYKCKNLFRNAKHKKARRNSGGISVLTKNNIAAFIKPVLTTAEHFIWIRISKELTGYTSDTFCCCAYIPPVNSPYYESHPDINLFDLLKDDISKFSKHGHIMVMGDLNARIGLKPETLTVDDFNPITDNLSDLNQVWAPPRCSIDTRSNSWGNELIDVCTAHNICLLNGRKVGDFEGRCTYFGIGSSVIDVSIVDRELFSHTLAFKVHNLTEFSDHCKIETILACKPREITVEDPTITPLTFDKYVFNQETSPIKLDTTLKSAVFANMKNKILSTNYPSSSIGCNKLSDDVQNLTKFLHDSSCDKIRVGKKPRAKAKRQKWFTPDCQSLRKKVRRAANFLSKHPFNPLAREEFFSVNRKYKKMIKKAKKSHRDNNMNKLINSIDKNEMWSILSDIKGKKSGAPIPMNELHTHFKFILNNAPKNVAERKINYLQAKVDEFVKDRAPSADSVPTGGYSAESLCKMAKKLKNGKSAFTDGTTNEVLKHSIHDTAPIFVKFFNLIETSSTYPTAWKSSFLVPLHKKGSHGDPDNYRGLAVGSNTSKFYTTCLNSKLKNFIDSKNILSPHQFGFREDFRTHDAIFSLRSMVSHYKNNRKQPVYSCFVDFSKAFDSVNRTALAFKLGQVGIKGNLLNLIQDMYSNTKYIIKSDGKFSTPLTSGIGVKQGCTLSPLLFNIFINDLHQIFDPACKPLNVNNWKVSSLSFADDLVLLSETGLGLQNSISKLESYCNEWGLKVNITKTKVVVFNKSYSKNIKKLYFHIDNEQIAVTNSYCYLGVDISNTGSFKKATDSLYKKALRALYSIYSSLDVRSDASNIRLYLKLFDSLVQPVLLYGSEIWGPQCLAGNNVISKFVNKFYHVLLGVKRHCSNTGVLAELGRYPIEINIAKAMLKYWVRIASLPKTRLAAHCYWTLFEQTNLNDPWIDAIKNIINSTGQYHIWSNQTDFFQSHELVIKRNQRYILQTLQDLYLQYSIQKIESESKLHLFKTDVNPISTTKYLLTTFGRAQRSALSNLRLGTTELEVENGRKFGIPHEARYCKLCNLQEVEDELHFLLTCPTLEYARKPYIDNICDSVRGFVRYNKAEKMNYLYYNDNLRPSLQGIAADMLIKLKSARVLELARR